MSMSPQEFQDLMISATTPEPPQGDVGSDVAVGRRLLRRRRARVALGTAAAVVGIAGTAWAVAPGSDSAADRGGMPVAPPKSAPAAPATDGSLLERCHDGNQSHEASAAIFGAGQPSVKAVSRTEHQVIAAIESGDGSHWAECFVHLDSQEFASGMTVYDGSGTSTSTSYSSGPGCGLVDGGVDHTCSTWVVSWVDRLPAEVAAVRFETGDGRSTEVPSRDGYVVLNYQAPLPDGTRLDAGGSVRGLVPITRVTYLDGDGSPIAAEAMDGSGTGPDHVNVGDLPRLSAFPALRAGEAIW
jgi:hypothetical protein